MRGLSSNNDRDPTPATFQRTFLCLALVFGLVFALVTPAFKVPDELPHLVRAYRVSQGNFLLAADLEDSSIPRSVPGLFTQLYGLPSVLSPQSPPMDPSRYVSLLGEPLRIDEVIPVSDVPVWVPVYSPVPYLPQALAMAGGRALEVSPLALLLLGRLANLLVWISATWIAIGLIPTRRCTLLLVALMPTSLFQAASLSPDAMTNGLAFLLVSAILRAIVEPRPMKSGEGLLLLGLTLAFSLCKPSYSLLACLVVLVPTRRFGGIGARLGWVSAVLVLASLPALLWNAAIPPERLIPNEQANPDQQLRLMLGYPLDFLGVLFNTVTTTWPSYVASFVGLLGHVWLTPWLFILYPTALLAVALTDGAHPKELGPWRRSVLMATAIGMGVLILALQYIIWNPVRGPFIEGGTGRYFIALAPAFLAALPSTGLRLPWALPIAVSLVTLSMVISLHALLTRYYIL